MHILIEIKRKEKEKMMPIFDKKEFYKMLLRDRLPVAKIEFPTEHECGKVEFIHTPLGVLLHIHVNRTKLNEIKMYNKNLGDFALQNIFCGENLIQLDDGSYVSISSKIKIEDVIGRSFLVKLENANVIARAEFMFGRRSNIDKSQTMVYN